MSFEKLGFPVDIFITIVICIGFYLMSLWYSVKYRDKYLRDKLEWHQAQAASPKRKVKFSNKYKQRRFSYLTLSFGIFWIVFYLVKPLIKNIIDYL
jgi:TRAP-type C4-dicarboxylate transport system permease small subunit